MNTRSSNMFAAFSQYRGERTYRAVLFRSPNLDSIEAIAKLFDGLPIGHKQGVFSIAKQNVTGIRVYYESQNCYLRTSNLETKNALIVKQHEDEQGKKKNVYGYEVCVLMYARSKVPLFLVAVPFSGMARELFGKIHDHRPSTDFKYLHPSLEDLLTALVQNEMVLEKNPETLDRNQEQLSCLKTKGINWTIAGETGATEQITLRGKNVIKSKVFSYLRAPEENLALSIRRLQLVHESIGGTEKLKISFDKFGNYSVWAAEHASNLADLFTLYDLFQKNDFIRESTAFPVRDQNEEPLLP